MGIHGLKLGALIATLLGHGAFSCGEQSYGNVNSTTGAGLNIVPLISAGSPIPSGPYFSASPSGSWRKEGPNFSTAVTGNIVLHLPDTAQRVPGDRPENIRFFSTFVSGFKDDFKIETSTDNGQTPGSLTIIKSPSSEQTETIKVPAGTGRLIQFKYARATEDGHLGSIKGTRIQVDPPKLSFEKGERFTRGGIGYQKAEAS